MLVCDIGAFVFVHHSPCSQKLISKWLLKHKYVSMWSISVEDR